MQVDSTKIEQVVPNLHTLWDGLFQITGYLTILYFLIGWPCFVGLGVMILAAPSQAMIMKKLFGINIQMVKYTDDRVKTTNEAVQGIRCVKMYTWEDSFKDVISGSRSMELNFLGKQAYLRGFSRAYMTSLPVIVAVVSFAVYAVGYDGATINASTLFSALVAFDQLRFPLLFYPMTLALYAQAKVSIGRLEEFLRMEEIKFGDNDNNVKNTEDDIGIYIRQDESLKTGEMKVDNVTIYWSDPDTPIVKADDDASSVGSKGSKSSKGSKKSGKDSSKQAKNGVVLTNLDAEMQTSDNLVYPKAILGDVTLDVAPGELCAIVGRVGSGKTTLASALLNEAVIRNGTIGLKGSIAYAAQTPWILNATLRDNITFGLPYEKEKYDNIIRACQLNHDLSLLDFGDMTEIGENGINLSGGQRQRVSVARAAYCGADIIIFDDPLSALDPEVGQKLFDQCIVKLLKGKTRIFATNQLQFLRYCDTIVALGDRRILEQGSYDELSKNNGAVQKLLDEFSVVKEEPASEMVKESSGRARSDSNISLGKSHKNVSGKDPKENEGLVSEEERNVGAVSFQVYKKYVAAGGGLCRALVIVFVFMLCTLNGILNTAWVSVWTADAEYERNSRSFYLGIYAAIACVLGVLTFVRAFILARFSIHASSELHKNALNSVLNAPQSFFDTTPTGRILSRFSKDLYSIDLELSDSLDFFVFGM